MTTRNDDDIIIIIIIIITKFYTKNSLVSRTHELEQMNFRIDVFVCARFGFFFLLLPMFVGKLEFQQEQPKFVDEFWHVNHAEANIQHLENSNLSQIHCKWSGESF